MGGMSIGNQQGNHFSNIVEFGIRMYES